MIVVLAVLVCCLGLCLAFVCGCGCGWALRAYLAEPQWAAPVAAASAPGLRAAGPALRRLAGYRAE